MRQLSAVLVLAAVLLTIGCGGGSTSGTKSATTPGQAQGVFSGTASNGLSFQTIVLPNDKLFGIYGVTSGNVLSISGMITGQGASSSGKYAATITDFYNTGATHSGSVAATYVTGSSINGTLTETGISNITFNGTAISGSSFNYNSPAVVSDIDGVWSGTIQDGTTAIVVINSNGTFTGSDSGCAFSGTLTPDSSGKNFLNISLTYGGSPCLSPGQVQSGVAVDYLLSDGVTRQLLAGVVSGNTAGTFFVANK